MHWQTFAVLDAQQVVNGIFLGSIYALFALGYTLVFGVLDILNVAHAAIFMVAAFAAWWVAEAYGQNLLVAMLVAALVGGLLGLLLDRIAFWPLRRQGAPQLSALISSIAVATMLEGAALAFSHTETKYLPAAVVPDGRFTLGNGAGAVTITFAKLVVLGTALLGMVALTYLVQRTRLGREMRAVAESPKAAALLGINIERVIMITFFIASALGGVAGLLFAVKDAPSPVSYDMGSKVELKGLAVIILGGMGSIPGSVVGGFLLGISEVLTIALGASGYSDAIPFAILFLMLLVRPSGLFGSRARRAG